VDRLIERGERFTIGGPADDDGTGDFRRVERVERLAEFVEDEIGDIHDVVDRAQADRLQPVFEPGRAVLDGDPGDADGRVERAGVRRVDPDGGGRGGGHLAGREFEWEQRGV